LIVGIWLTLSVPSRKEAGGQKKHAEVLSHFPDVTREHKH
jgi:hypothetical protein